MQLDVLQGELPLNCGRALPPAKESLLQQGAPTLTGTLRPLKVSTSSCSSRPLLLQKAARTSAGQVRVQTADRYLGTLWYRKGVQGQHINWRSGRGSDAQC